MSGSIRRTARYMGLLLTVLLLAGAGPGALNEIDGTADTDRIRGTSASERILGLGGSDTLRGWGGDDRLVGGPGDDVLVGGLGQDTFVCGPGEDVVVVGFSRDGQLEHFGDGCEATVFDLSRGVRSSILGT